MSIRDTLRAVSVDEHRRLAPGERARSNRHFGERRHAWAIDTGDGKLIPVRYFIASRIPLNPAITGIGTAIFATRREARQQWFRMRRLPGAFPHARIVKVRVSYEVVS